MKVDPKTAHQIAAGQVTAVLRARKLVRDREPVQFERARGEDDRAPRHANDDTVLDTKCIVTVLEQRDVTLGKLTDEDAKRLGYRSVFMLRQTMGEEWVAGRQQLMVRFELVRTQRPRYIDSAGGYTESPSRSIDTVEMIVQTPSGPVRRDVALESVSEDDLRRFAAESNSDRERRRRREEIDRRALSLEERIVRVRAEARRVGADLTRQETRALAALKAKSPGRALAAVESMERKVQSKAA